MTVRSSRRAKSKGTHEDLHNILNLLPFSKTHL